MVQVGGLQNIGRFDNPLASARGNKDAQDGRVQRHQQAVGVVSCDLTNR